VPIPFLRQRSLLRTTKTIPCEATNVLNADAGVAWVVPTPIIAMPTAPAATSFCTSALSVVIKVAAFSQHRGGATRRLPADQHRY